MQVPQWKLWAYIRMLPRLEAQHELRDYRVALAAGGLQMDEHGHARYINRLERRAEGIIERPQLSPQETREQLAASPLKVVVEKEKVGHGG